MKVSVVIPSYNHAAYISETIASILSQSEPPYEVIVVDDGSRDDSRRIIESFPEDRVRRVFFPANRGACEALNHGIGMVRGDFIASCSSDDSWAPDKLRIQKAFLAASPEIGVVFSNAATIDEAGTRHRSAGHIREGLFYNGNRSRWAWMKRLVEHGNSICHPSILARKQVYADVGGYDNRLRQLPDFDMWLRVVQRHAIHVQDLPLVNFRVLTSAENTSKPVAGNAARERNEFAAIVERFLRGLPAEDFVRAFGALKDPAAPGFDLDVERVLYLWSIGGRWVEIFRHIGRTLLMELFGRTGGVAAWTSYGFTADDAFLLRGISSPWVDRARFGALTDPEVRLLARVEEQRLVTDGAGPPGRRPQAAAPRRLSAIPEKKRAAANPAPPKRSVPSRIFRQIKRIVRWYSGEKR